MATLVASQSPIHNPSHLRRVQCFEDAFHTFCHLKVEKYDRQLDFCNKHTKVLKLKELTAEFLEEKIAKDSEVALTDGTIVDDDDYLESLPEETVLMLTSDSSGDETDGSSLEADSDGFDKEDHKVFQTAVNKLQNNLGSVVLLSQCELQVLHEAEEKQLMSHLNLSAADAEEFKWLCFDIYSKRDENEEALSYMDLMKQASEWEKAKKKEEEKNEVQADCAGSDSQEEAVGSQEESLHHHLTSSESSPDNSPDNLSDQDILEFDGDIESDGVTSGVHTSLQGEATAMNDKDELIQRLKPKLKEDLAPLMSLKEEEYEVLLMHGALKELGVPPQSLEDAERYCKDQRKSLKRKRELMEYFES